MKKVLFVAALLLGLGLLSCKKDIMTKESSKKVKELATSGESFSSTGESTLLLTKNASFANQTYGTMNNQKIGSFVLLNQLAFPVRINTVQVSFFTNSSTGEIPVGAVINLLIPGTSNLIAAPVVNGNINSFTVNSTIIQPSAVLNLSVFSDLVNPAYSFFTKMRVIGINTITGEKVVTNIVNGQTVSVINGGSTLNCVFVPVASTTSRYIACGNTGVQDSSKFVINIRSIPFGSKIIELKYQVLQPGTVTSIRVDGLTSSFVNNYSTVSGLNIIVPAGGVGTDIYSYISYPSVGYSGVPSGTKAAVSLVYVKYLDVVAGTVSTLNCNIQSPEMTLVYSKPIVFVNPAVHVGFALGAENKIGEVSVTADSHGDIIQSSIFFTVSSAGINGFTISNPRIANGSITIAGSSCITNTLTVMANFNSGFRIPAGTTVTFSLYATVSGTLVPGNNPLVVTTLQPSIYSWTDISGNGLPNAENGYLINNFPVYGYTLTQ